MKTLFLLFVSALLLPLIGQGVKIVILDKSDTTVLKSEYQAYKTAQERWEKAKSDMAKKYVSDGGKVLDGWSRVDFSVDFRAMVPHVQTPTYSTFYSGSGSYAPISAINISGGADNLTVSVDPDLVTIDGKLDVKGKTKN